METIYCTMLNASITHTWDAGDARWEDIGNLGYVKWDGAKWICHFQAEVVATCYVNFKQTIAPEASCPPKTGWVVDGTQSCTDSGSPQMTLEYGACP